MGVNLVGIMGDAEAEREGLVEASSGVQREMGLDRRLGPPQKKT